MSTPVTVVCGPDRDPALLIAHRLPGAERGGGRYEAGVVELKHGCVSRTPTMHGCPSRRLSPTAAPIASPPPPQEHRCSP